MAEKDHIWGKFLPSDLHSMNNAYSVYVPSTELPLRFCLKKRKVQHTQQRSTLRISYSQQELENNFVLNLNSCSSLLPHNGFERSICCYIFQLCCKCDKNVSTLTLMASMKHTFSMKQTAII